MVQPPDPTDAGSAARPEPPQAAAPQRPAARSGNVLGDATVRKLPDPASGQTGGGPSGGRESGPLTPSALRGIGGRPTFFEGEVLARRYRIVRFVASGGMGEVYE